MMLERVAGLVREAGGGEVHFLEMRIEFAGADEADCSFLMSWKHCATPARHRWRKCGEKMMTKRSPEIIADDRLQ